MTSVSESVHRPSPGWDAAEHPREQTGRFAPKLGAAPEVTLGGRWEEVWEFDDDSVMLVERTNVVFPEYKRAWLRDHQGEVIGMIHWSHKPGERFGEACICDIEVREEHRGRGVAKRLILSVEDRIGDRLHTSGGFTPEGEAALGKTPQHPGQPKPKHGYRSMNFVHDWDSMAPIR